MTEDSLPQVIAALLLVMAWGLGSFSLKRSPRKEKPKVAGMDLPSASSIPIGRPPRGQDGTKYTFGAFTDFVRTQEAGENHRGPDGRWMPHRVAGLWHIGRGHLINSGKSPAGYESGLMDAQVEALFASDLQRAVSQARVAVGEEAWAELDNRRKFMLSDFAFNIGPDFDQEGKFPKFTKGVLEGNEQVMRKEYPRFYRNASTGDTKPLSGRNAAFSSFFELEEKEQLARSGGGRR